MAYPVFLLFVTFFVPFSCHWFDTDECQSNLTNSRFVDYLLHFKIYLYKYIKLKGARERLGFFQDFKFIYIP